MGSSVRPNVKTLNINARNPGPYTGAGNNTYLLLGSEPTLIDAGVGQSDHLDEVAAALAVLPRPHGTAEPTLARVLVTHGHSDHASGCEAIRARWPRTVFLKMPWPERDHRYPVPWQRIGDGEVVPAGDGRLQAIHTPGHAPDHLCFLDESSATLFSGDLVVEGGSVAIPVSIGGDLRRYLDSLRQIISLRPSRMLPAHGPAVKDPGAVLRRYLNHRQRREEQVLQALDEGHRLPDRIVERIYRGLPADWVGLAGENVVAHLRKLEAEGLVVEVETGEWHKAPGD